MVASISSAAFSYCVCYDARRSECYSKFGSAVRMNRTLYHKLGMYDVVFSYDISGSDSTSFHDIYQNKKSYWNVFPLLFPFHRTYSAYRFFLPGQAYYVHNTSARHIDVSPLHLQSLDA